MRYGLYPSAHHNYLTSLDPGSLENTEEFWILGPALPSQENTSYC